jgi:hypothetical protein
MQRCVWSMPSSASTAPRRTSTSLNCCSGRAQDRYDPEIRADIYELGPIYKVGIDDDRMVNIEMTLTTPNCPSAEELPRYVAPRRTKADDSLAFTARRQS